MDQICHDLEFAAAASPLAAADSSSKALDIKVQRETDRNLTPTVRGKAFSTVTAVYTYTVHGALQYILAPSM